MWTHLITFLVGFVAGGKFKDIIGNNYIKDRSDKSSNSSIKDEPFSLTNESKKFEYANNGYKSKVTTGFSLYSIKHVFDNYSIDIIDTSSFNVLLREVRSKCYKKFLETIVTKATSPQKLVDLLKTETMPTFNVEMLASDKPPFIEASKLDELIRRENINPKNVGNLVEKVSFLLTLSHTRGIEDFKNTLGYYFSDIIKSADSNDDISEQYEEIMKIIKNRYQFMK